MERTGRLGADSLYLRNFSDLKLLFSQVVLFGVFAMSTPNIEPHLLNKSNMAKSCGVSTQAFDKWGVNPEVKQGRAVFFSVKEVLENRLKNERDKLQGKTPKKANPKAQLDQLDEDALRTKKLQEEIRALELKNDILEGRSIPVDIALDVMTAVITEQVAILETLPLLVKRQNTDLPSHVIDQFQKAIAQVSNNAATLGDRFHDQVSNFVSAAEGKIK